MAKRHVYPACANVDLSWKPVGIEPRAHGKPLCTANNTPWHLVTAPAVRVPSEWEQFTKRASHYMWHVYCAMSGNYVAIVTVFVVVLLSLLLPDFSQKISTTQEIKSMKKILDKMSTEVKRAEVACLTVADEICCLHCTVQDDTTETSLEKIQDLSLSPSSVRTTQSEPVSVEKKVGFFRRIFFPNRNASHKEVTIMSYVYTDSFDAKKTVNSPHNN